MKLLQIAMFSNSIHNYLINVINTGGAKYPVDTGGLYSSCLEFTENFQRLKIRKWINMGLVQMSVFKLWQRRYIGGFAVNWLIHWLLKRRRPTRDVMHFPELDKCAVCHDPAGPHIYYGARVSRGRWRGEFPDKWYLIIPLTRLVCPAEPSSRDL